MKTTKLKPFEIVLAVICVILLFVSYLNVRKRKQILEIKNLPFTNVSVDQIDDGIYTGKAETSLMCVKIQVSVENHQITDIKILERSGTKKSDKAELLFEKMKKENKAFVSVEEGEELIDLIYICCVDNALSQSLNAEIENNVENPGNM